MLFLLWFLWAGGCYDSAGGIDGDFCWRVIMMMTLVLCFPEDYLEQKIGIAPEMDVYYLRAVELSCS